MFAHLERSMERKRREKLRDREREREDDLEKEKQVYYCLFARSLVRPKPFSFSTHRLREKNSVDQQGG